MSRNLIVMPKSKNIRSELDEFLNPNLSINTLEKYYVRKSILIFLTNELPFVDGTLLDVGCGKQPYRDLFMSPSSKVSDYIGLDIESATYGEPTPDLLWDGKIIPLADASVDCATATEVFEHCPDPQIVANEIHRVLKPGGRFVFTVPFLWPLHDVPYDFYRFTPFAMRAILEQAGFSQVSIQALGGWDASLGQMIALWVRRRMIHSKALQFLRPVISAISLPVLWILYRKDTKPTHFNQCVMITGLCGTAVKK
jgi:SAM-dependent methyltransferase